MHRLVKLLRTVQCKPDKICPHIMHLATLKHSYATGAKDPILFNRKCDTQGNARQNNKSYSFPRAGKSVCVKKMDAPAFASDCVT
jgi:hypothetical protein